MKKGKFIVIDGSDGSGKATQTALLFSHFKKQGYKVSKADFPRHGEPPAWMVDQYLTGKYGTAKELGPYVPSIFYACDRFDASAEIKKKLENGEIVLSDRYISSNIGHQGGKIRSLKKRQKYLNWLFELEYGIFNIPKPDITFVLSVPPEISVEISKKVASKEKEKRLRSYLGKEKKDIHEKDLLHLKQALESYLWVAKKFPKEYKIVDCVKSGKLISPDAVHEIIWKSVKKII
jgi:dTMP kinase